MSEPTNYHSFLVRLQAVTELPDTQRWHIDIAHIQSGESYSFDTFDELVLFLSRHMDPAEKTNRLVENAGDNFLGSL
jgi:hypothetical protein